MPYEFWKSNIVSEFFYGLTSPSQAVMTLHLNSRAFVHAFFFLHILNATTTIIFLLLILPGGGGCLKNQSGLSLTSPIVYTVFSPNFHKFCICLRSVIFLENAPLITFITDEVGYICALCKLIYSRQKVHDSVSAYYVHGIGKSIFTHVQTHILLISFHHKFSRPCNPYPPNQRAHVYLLCYWCCAFFDHCDKHHIRIPVVSVSTPFCKSHIVSGYLYNLIIIYNK